MKALVTGANGFLGRHVVSALIAHGVSVRAMARPAAAVDKLGWPASVEVVRADLRTSRDLEKAFDGIDVLVHLAAVVSGGEDAQFAGTVAGTERLLDAMTRTQCRRIVLCSSFSVYNYSEAKGKLDELSPVHKAPDVYARDGYTIAKWWQERVTKRFVDQHGWELTILRPGFIWGRDNGYLGALGQQFGRHHLVIGPRTRIPMSHVENCADAFAVATLDKRAIGETFNIVDGPGEQIGRYLADHQAGARADGWRIPVPYGLAISAVRAAHLLVFRHATKVPGILMPERFEARFKPLHFSNAKLRQTLGWTPPFDYKQCLEKTYGSLSVAGSKENATQPALSREARESRDSAA